MDILINLNPVHQTGHNCKSTAIATVDKYFAEKIGFEPIPLHKKKEAAISIRQLSKTKGSRQGELLEARQLSEIFVDLGYEAELIDFQDNYDLFKHCVTHNIKTGHLVIACFSVDRRTQRPSTRYKAENEHAAILHGFNDETGALDITHWGRSIRTTMKDFYDSSMVLLKERNPEYYINIKQSNKVKKYELYSDQTGAHLPAEYKKSLIPSSNSGFRGKLFVIKQPELKHILEARQILLCPANVRKLLTDFQLEIDELITMGNKKIKYHGQNQKMREIAVRLNAQLDDAKKKFFTDHTITISQFKQTCMTAIEAAELEFKKHHGWHQISLILRIILGVLAIIMVIPFIAIAIGTRQGYRGTFFKTPETDLEKNVELFKQNLICLK